MVKLSTHNNVKKPLCIQFLMILSWCWSLHVDEQLSQKARELPAQLYASVWWYQWLPTPWPAVHPIIHLCPQITILFRVRRLSPCSTLCKCFLLRLFCLSGYEKYLTLSPEKMTWFIYSIIRKQEYLAFNVNLDQYVGHWSLALQLLRRAVISCSWVQVLHTNY